MIFVLFCGREEVRFIKPQLRKAHPGAYQVLGHITSLRSLEGQLASLKRQMSESGQPRLLIFLSEDFSLLERGKIRHELLVCFPHTEVITDVRALNLALERAAV